MIKKKLLAYCGRCGRGMIQINDHEGEPCWTPMCRCPDSAGLTTDIEEAQRLWRKTMQGGRR